MAEASLNSHDAGEASASGKNQGGLFSVVKAVAFVSILVLLEIAAAATLAPSAMETERLAQQLAGQATEEHAETHGEEHGDEHGGGHGDSTHIDKHALKEVAMGSYNVTRYNPTTNTTLAIDFELYGTVLGDDATEFEHLFENSKARIREQVTMTLHAAQSSDLTDAGLGLIKRQILEKTNRAIGQPLLKEVLFSKFSFVER